MLHQVSGAGGLGVVQLVLGAGPVVAAVLWLLVAFSIGSWGIILYKLIQISQARRESEKFIAIFWESKNLAAIHTASVGLKRSPVAQVFRAGYQELLQLTRAKRQAVGSDSGFSTDLGGIANVMRAMKRQENVELTKLEAGITFLATTGSSCTFIGLFGTVVGIITAFLGLSTSHTSSIQAVAPGIAEALIATAAGLIAAIPAQMFYNYFIARVRVLATEMDNFTSEFLNIAERHFLS
ncbi:MAG TPA: MotA/TolQ/ExbB proton channel family protein [Candidatus Binatus sp.]|jgi:biopolymer transport protein TolQ|uniref:MotA/TolQ/ExbB proton channel family protein n=1 Tax=Candidatus Binatus sp. TaxID=2811406 RepID=UPI002F41F136